MKKYLKYALVFLVLGLAAGVFYREFTKALGVVNVYTPLGLVHPHLLVLGVLVITIAGLVTTRLQKEDDRLVRLALPIYASGVLGAGVMLLIRGIFDVMLQADKISSLDGGASAAISGITGLLHIVLATGLILFFIAWLRKTRTPKESV